MNHVDANAIDILTRVPLFAGLPRDEIERLAQTLPVCELSDGAVLFREGDRGDRLYIVREGQIEIIKSLGADGERVLSVRGAGEFIGEMSLFNPDGLRTAGVRARGAVKLWAMSRQDFLALVQRFPNIAFELSRMESARLTAADNNTIRDLLEKNRQLQQAYDELKAAQAQIIEKEKLERELQVAAEIQRSILPAGLPQMPGYDFGARMIPARMVGGDFFDFIPFDENKIGIAIGDVSDKGIPAAIFMAQTHALLRAVANPALSPAATLQRVNQHLLTMNSANLFVTVLYGILDCASGAFAYARAGHELPLVLSRDGTFIEVHRQNGLMLGVFPDSAIDEQTIAMPPGGTLLLNTDGVTDCLNPTDENFGGERLQATLRACASRSAQATCDELIKTLMAFQSTAQQADDITLVVVHLQ